MGTVNNYAMLLNVMDCDLYSNKILLLLEKFVTLHYDYAHGEAYPIARSILLILDNGYAYPWAFFILNLWKGLISLQLR